MRIEKASIEGIPSTRDGEQAWLVRVWCSGEGSPREVTIIGLDELSSFGIGDGAVYLSRTGSNKVERWALTRRAAEKVGEYL